MGALSGRWSDSDFFGPLHLHDARLVNDDLNYPETHGAYLLANNPDPRIKLRGLRLRVSSVVKQLAHTVFFTINWRAL